MPIPTVPPPAQPEPAVPACVRTVGRPDVDVLWGRPIFKAPPLQLAARPLDLASAVAAPGTPHGIAPT